MIALFSFLLLYIDHSGCSNWFPVDSSSTLVNSLFRPVDSQSLQQRFYAEFKSQVDPLDTSVFRWTATTILQNSKEKDSWIIAAGSAFKSSDAGVAFNSKFSAVFGCQILPDTTSPSGFKLSACELIQLDVGSRALNNTDAGYLGRGLQSLDLSDRALLIFCDPLWHTLDEMRFPGGRCELRTRRHNRWKTQIPVDFCNSAGHTQPCAGGFSVDIRQTEDGSNAQLLAGLPIAQPKRRARVIDNLLPRSGAHRHVRDIEKEEDSFGTSVAWSMLSPSRSDALAIVASPPETVYGYRSNRGLEDIDDAVLKASPKVPFGGFGFATETSLVEGRQIVFAGAPHERVGKEGSNTGRVYATCWTHEGTTNSSVDGLRTGEMFGYAITRIGDVDGDGIGDVAISAPALDSKDGLVGRVYIYRVMPTCDLHTEPFQVLEAADGIAGFGVAISRGVDIDSDGGPELAVTTLDPHNPVILYSLPRRLRAICTYKATPEVPSKTIRINDPVKLRFTVTLVDLATGQQFPAPTRFVQRTHQVNPDVLWLQQFQHLSATYNNSEFDSIVAEFFAIKQSPKLAADKPRFQLDGRVRVDVTSNGAITAYATLRAAENGNHLALDTLPLHVAFRSILTDPLCADYAEGCEKKDQPLIDWSNCVWKMPPTAYFCPQHKKCSGDLQISSTEPKIKVPFGARDAAQQTATFRLVNLGPTKSAGVRVELRSTGWPMDSSQSGIRARIDSVQLRVVKTGKVIAASNVTRSDVRWMVRVASNGAAALVTARQGTAFYADEEYDIVVSAFLAGVADVKINGNELPSKDLPPPGIHANVSAAIFDPDLTGNEARVEFQVVYRPMVRINPGEAPPTLVDERKNAPNLNGIDSKIVLSHEIGPRVDHVFLVENYGDVDLHNIQFRLDIPVRTDSGEMLLYLTQKARLLDEGRTYHQWVQTLPTMVSANGSEVGQCEIDGEFIDPLHLLIREASSEVSSRRIRRHAEDDDLTPVTYVGPFGENRVRVHFKRSCQRQLTISCTEPRPDDPIKNDLDFKVICARVTCRLAKLSHADTVRVKLTGWLWTPTYFYQHLPDVKFVTTLGLTDWGTPPKILSAYPSATLDYPAQFPSYSMPQSVVFRGVTGKYLDRMPLWPIIVGVVLGSILLFGVIASLYLCGFFRRRQKTKEAKRKSMLAARYRRSMPPSDGGHPSAFLLNGKDKSLVADKDAAVYTANPMHAGSPDLIFASDPEPPTPPVAAEVELDVEQPVDVQEKQELLVEESDRELRESSPASSSGLPDWLMSELKQNEEKSKQKKKTSK